MYQTFNTILPENVQRNQLFHGKPEDIAISLRQLELLQDRAKYTIGGNYICIGTLQDARLDLYYDPKDFTFYYYNSKQYDQVIPKLSNNDYNICLRRAYACGLLSPKFFQEFGRVYIQNLGVEA